MSASAPRVYMSSSLTQNHFELFSLPQRYALEPGQLVKVAVAEDYASPKAVR